MRILSGYFYVQKKVTAGSQISSWKLSNCFYFCWLPNSFWLKNIKFFESFQSKKNYVELWFQFKIEVSTAVVNDSGLNSDSHLANYK